MIKHSTKPPAGKIQSIAFAIGVDVGDRFSRVCILDSDGVPCKEERVRTSEVGFRQYFERLAPSQIALEAGTHSGWVSRLLQTAVTSPSLPMLASCARFTRAIARMTEPTPRS